MTKKTAEYENNPFNIGLNGLKLLFANARNVAIYAIVLCVLLAIANFISSAVDTTNTLSMSEQELAAQQKATEVAVQEFFALGTSELVLIGVAFATAVFLITVILFWLYGVIDYTGARLAEGEQAELKQALKASAKNLAGYIWLYILIGIKVLLWSLLLIVPGIIMAVRYSLAGTVFFAEDKRGNEAIKRSLELTKGAWFTTFAGMGLWNIMTFGQITYLLQPGVNAILYRQFKQTPKKPAAHWLSWATLVAPIALLGFVVSLVVIIGLIWIAIAA